MGSSNGTIEVEAVGLDKVRGKFANLQKLREISLDNELVAEGNLTGQINKTCPSERLLSVSQISAQLILLWQAFEVLISPSAFCQVGMRWL